MMLLHSEHHRDKKMGGFLLHYAEASVYCVHVWQEMRQELREGRCVCVCGGVHLSVTHCSATTPTK